MRLGDFQGLLQGAVLVAEDDFGRAAVVALVGGDDVLQGVAGHASGGGFVDYPVHIGHLHLIVKVALHVHRNGLTAAGHGILVLAEQEDGAARLIHLDGLHLVTALHVDFAFALLQLFAGSHGEGMLLRGEATGGGRLSDSALGRLGDFYLIADVGLHLQFDGASLTAQFKLVGGDQQGLGTLLADGKGLAGAAGLHGDGDAAVVIVGVLGHGELHGSRALGAVSGRGGTPGGVGYVQRPVGHGGAEGDRPLSTLGVEHESIGQDGRVDGNGRGLLRSGSGRRLVRRITPPSLHAVHAVSIRRANR